MMQKPLNCKDCQKCVAVIYIEIVGQSKNTVNMCRDCPVLKEKVKGKSFPKERLKKKETLYCTCCGTSLSSVLMGDRAGCSQCYHDFEEALVTHLLETKQISRRFQSGLTGLSPALHVGRVSFKSQRSEKSAQIRELKEALKEAIKGENYEEAAWLRDQIYALTKGADNDS